MNIKIACAVTKKKCPGREVKDLFFFLSEGHRGSFSRILLCDFFLCLKFVGGGGVLIPPPPSQIYAWIGKLLKKPFKVIIINVLLILNKIKHTVLT